MYYTQVLHILLLKLEAVEDSLYNKMSALIFIQDIEKYQKHSIKKPRICDFLVSVGHELIQAWSLRKLKA